MTNDLAIRILNGDVLGTTEQTHEAVAMAVKALSALPSAQPEKLTDDDFETIRIHLNAYKEKLCNQHRWKEAEEYQRIIDRFIAFASAQPVVRCKDCKHWRRQTNYAGAQLSFGFCESDDMWRSLYGETYEVSHIDTDDDFYCGYAERREDG